MAKPKLALIPAAQGSRFYSVLPSSGIGDFSFTRNTSATRINKDGYIETVPALTSRLNYPMIDGVVKGCPHHLLEPQTTNIGKYSEQISSWSKGRATVSDNQGISPDGTQNASKLTVTNEANTHVVYFNNTNVITEGLNYVMSIFVKKSTTNYIRFSEGFSNSNLIFNFDTEELTASGNSTINDLGVEKYPNNWYRLSMKFIGDASLDVQSAIFIRDNNNNESYTGSNEAVFIWGLQIEQSTFTTSYIKNPSTGSTTRSAETANNSGDASTFNDSEGVLMAEVSSLVNSDTYRLISLNDNSNSNEIFVGFRFDTGKLYYNIDSGGVGQSSFISDVTALNTSCKFCVKYKQNDISFYINGFKLYSDSSANMPTGLSVLKMSRGNDTLPFYGNTKQIQYFDSALTDSELETLTSWVSFQDMAESQLYSIK